MSQSKHIDFKLYNSFDDSTKREQYTSFNSEHPDALTLHTTYFNNKKLLKELNPKSQDARKLRQENKRIKAQANTYLSKLNNR